MKSLRHVGFLLVLFCAAGFVTTSAYAKPVDGDGAGGLVLKGDSQCTECHDEADEPLPSVLGLKHGVLAIAKTKHGTRADGNTPTCTDCHGDSLDHKNYRGSGKPPKPDVYYTKGTVTPAALRSEKCLACHGKESQRHFWPGSAHDNADVTCTSCHDIHTDHDKVRDKLTQAGVCFTCHKDKRAEVRRPSHHPVMEGKVTCSDCHNPHGTAGPKLLVRDSVNDTCYQCHMEKRGPFLHNHQPVNENCSICHNPHGTIIGFMLKSRPPFLCQECHSEDGHPGQLATQPTGPTTSFTALGTIGRGCLNCHTAIHGDNNPQGATATRRFFR
ncbi:MAG: DmsE family decaheme c-type cytochrome [Gammaproteobacteria bacterium]|nr:DmsE family decaheme c-type cytochrome [Gammaproteobacteria bacterium]